MIIVNLLNVLYVVWFLIGILMLGIALYFARGPSIKKSGRELDAYLGNDENIVVSGGQCNFEAISRTPFVFKQISGGTGRAESQERPKPVNFMASEHYVPSTPIQPGTWRLEGQSRVEIVLTSQTPVTLVVYPDKVTKVIMFLAYVGTAVSLWLITGWCLWNMFLREVILR